jgi:hypothetical protein
MQVELRGGFIVFVGVLRREFLLVGLGGRLDEPLLLNDLREQLLVICLFLSKYLLEFFVVHELVEDQRVLYMLQELKATTVLRLLHILLLLLYLLDLGRCGFFGFRLVLLLNAFVPNSRLLAVAGLWRDFRAVNRLLFVQHGGWLVQGVNSDPKSVVEQLGDDACEQRAANFETGVRVGLNHHHFEIFIDHEVVPENFKRIPVTVGI